MHGRDTMKRTFAMSVLLAGLAVLTGCEPHGMMTLPEHFVEMDVDRSGYTKRGISADGVVVAFQVRENLKNGSSEFWTDAIRSDLTGRGYRLEKEEDVENSAGQPGKLMTFSAKQQGSQFTYMLAVFVTAQRVVTAEGGGKSEAVAKRADAIRASLLSAR